ncbi:MAG: hypothetical protein ACRC0L_00155, partial [Angustibacter sp.]
QDQLLMNAYAVALRSIDWELIREEDVQKWREWISEAPTSVDYEAVRLALSAGIRDIKDVPSSGVSLGEIAAELNASIRFSDIQIPQSRVIEMSNALIEDMRGIRRNAESGMSSFGTLNSPGLAAMLALEHSSGPLWQGIVDLLADRKVARDLKVPALERLSVGAADVDPEFVRLMEPRYEDLANSAPMRMSGDDDEGLFAAAVSFAASTGILPPERILSDVSLLASDSAPRTRVEAAKALRGVARRADPAPLWSLALLVQLCRDRDATVRAHAGQGLALAHVDGYGMVSLRQQVLEGLIGDAGVLVPLLVVQGLDLRWHDSSARESVLLNAVGRLRNESLSHLVRRAADHALLTATGSV